MTTRIDGPVINAKAAESFLASTAAAVTEPTPEPNKEAGNPPIDAARETPVAPTKPETPPAAEPSPAGEPPAEPKPEAGKSPAVLAKPTEEPQELEKDFDFGDDYRPPTDDDADAGADPVAFMVDVFSQMNQAQKAQIASALGLSARPAATAAAASTTAAEFDPIAALEASDNPLDKSIAQKMRADEARIAQLEHRLQDTETSIREGNVQREMGRLEREARYVAENYNVGDRPITEKHIEQIYLYLAQHPEVAKTMTFAQATRAFIPSARFVGKRELGRGTPSGGKTTPAPAGKPSATMIGPGGVAANPTATPKAEPPADKGSTNGSGRPISIEKSVAAAYRRHFGPRG
jgi:hypothetical protein